MNSVKCSYKSFIGDTLAYRESSVIEPQILERMVERLREGDRAMIDPIIAGHYHLVTAIVAGSLRRKGKSADIEAAAFLSLVETVHNCCPHWEGSEFMPSRLYDNNITFYITTNVKYAIKDEYGSDHIIRVPPRTIRDKIVKGQKYEEIVPDKPIEFGDDDDGQSDDGGGESSSKSGMIMPFYIPIAPNNLPSIEFTEALINCTKGFPLDEAIIKLRKEGYTYEEIGKKVGYSVAMIGVIMPRIEARFNKLYP